MIGNLKVTDDLIKLAKSHPKTTIMGTLAFITAVVLAFTIPNFGGSKEENNTGDFRPPAIEERVEETEQKDFVPTIEYAGWDVTIDMGTTLTLEPGGGEYVGKVRVSDRAKLILIDGDYALVLYNVPQEKYNYDLSHDHRRLGYVPMENVTQLASYLSESAAADERYVCFDNSTRIYIDKEDGGILTTAKKGDYARVVGLVFGPEWSDDDWYIVAYGKFIGYMHGRNGTFISRDEMLEIVNTESEYLIIRGNNVNLRSNPQKGIKNVKVKLNKGDKALILEHTNGWYHVLYNGTEGYISDELTCLDKYFYKNIPEGLKYLHFENRKDKTI